MTEQISTMPSLPLKAGMVVRFEAVDPVTGNQFTDVTVSQAVIYAEDQTEDATSKPDLLPPLLADTV